MIFPWEKPFRCPSCHTDDPAVVLTTLVNHVVRGGAMKLIVTGSRVACQRCPAVYCIGLHGVFVQHRDSLPFVPQVGVSSGYGIAAKNENPPEKLKDKEEFGIPTRAPRM